MSVKWIAVTFGVMVVGYAALRAVDADILVPLIAAAALVLVGKRSGLSWGQMGLARATWRRGLAWALGATLVVALAYLVVVLTPLQVLLDDDRYGEHWGEALFTAFVMVPLGTVLWEELAFRGVLWGQLHVRWSTRVATVVSSLLFGLWHAIPAMRFADNNAAADAAADAVNQRGAVTIGTVAVTLGTVIITVLVTGLAGVVLCEMRRRSDSLLAPIGLHWAGNGLGALAVALVASQ